MTPIVYILVSCRKPELLPAALMVFDTIRVGFPTAKIAAHGNNLTGDALHEVHSRCARIGVRFQNIDPIYHHEWIEELVEKEDHPFVICDTDMVFWEKVEDWGITAMLAGRFVPEFMCEFMKARSQSRLHTSLLFIDPARLRHMRKVYLEQIPTAFYSPRPNLIYPQIVPLAIPGGMPVMYNMQQNLFFDTCSMLYHAVGGRAFVEDQLDCYDHLNCGTISDLVGPTMTDGKMQEHHRMIFENPELAKGIWRKQQEYLESRSPNRTAECAPCV